MRRKFALYVAVLNMLVLAVLVVLQFSLYRNQRKLIALQQQAIEGWRERAVRCEAGGDLVVR